MEGFCSSATGVAGATVEEGASEPIKVSQWRCITLRRLEDERCTVWLAPALSLLFPGCRLLLPIHEATTGVNGIFRSSLMETCNSTLFHVLNPMDVFFFHLHTQALFFFPAVATATATNTFLPSLCSKLREITPGQPKTGPLYGYSGQGGHQDIKMVRYSTVPRSTVSQHEPDEEACAFDMVVPFQRVLWTIPILEVGLS